MRFLRSGLSRITPSAAFCPRKESLGRVPQQKAVCPLIPPDPAYRERTLQGEPLEFCHMVCPRPSSKSQTKPSSQMQWGVGALGPAPSARAAQISMRLARRRQRGASTGIALRWISLPSRRSTCSFEKFMTSTTVQKLLMENSVGTRGAEVGGRSPDQRPGSTAGPDSPGSCLMPGRELGVFQD